MNDETLWLRKAIARIWGVPFSSIEIYCSHGLPAPVIQIWSYMGDGTQLEEVPPEPGEILLEGVMMTVSDRQAGALLVHLARIAGRVS
jgi:hypothetical protein